MEVTRLFDIPYYQLKHFPQKDSLAAKIDGNWVKTSTQSFVDQAMMVSKTQGELVKAREVIAISGSSGELSTGPHLHFELWNDGNPIDPLAFIDF